MTFEESIATGLRIRGDETTDDARRHRARYRWVANRLRECGVTSSQRVVDWGCGTGYGTRILRDAGFNAYGYEEDPEAVGWGAEWWGLHGHVGTTMPREVDVFVCMGVMEHIPLPIHVQLADLLRSAPLVIGFVPFMEPAGFNPHHILSRISLADFSGRPDHFWFEPLNYAFDVGVPMYHPENPPAPEPVINVFFEARRDPLKDKLSRMCSGTELVLDVGAGTRRMQRHIHPHCNIVSIDAFAPDLHSAAEPRGPLVNGYAEDVIPLFREDVFDVVVALDFLEHLTMEDARMMVANMKTVGRRICLFVPEGEHPQDGTSENPNQAHRSTWRREDLERLGFSVETWPDYHRGDPGKDSGAMWAEWRR